MKEIKFRAWASDEKRMLLWSTVMVQSLLQMVTDKRLTLMQYTGLKDKNGMEIYEGDIVAIPHNIVKAVIEWNDREACFSCRWDSDTTKVRKEVGMPELPGNLTSGGAGNPWGVIGNIYENKDLLK